MRRKLIPLLMMFALLLSLGTTAAADRGGEPVEEPGYVYHPMGRRLAERMAGDGADPDDVQAAYAKIMSWHEEGTGFGEIMMALVTKEMAGDAQDTVQSLLAQKQDVGWGEIWQEMDLIGDDEAGESEEPPESESEDPDDDGLDGDDDDDFDDPDDDDDDDWDDDEDGDDPDDDDDDWDDPDDDDDLDDEDDDFDDPDDDDDLDDDDDEDDSEDPDDDGFDDPDDDEEDDWDDEDGDDPDDDDDDDDDDEEDDEDDD